MLSNQTASSWVLDMIETLIEAGLYLLGEPSEDSSHMVERDIRNALNAMLPISEEIQGEEPLTRCKLIMKSASDSFDYLCANRAEYKGKIEFEFIPLLQELRLFLYFYGFVYPDQRKMKKFYAEELRNYYGNDYITEAVRMGEYAYDLSIMVTGYNKLDYTRLCVESLYRFIPDDIRYEIILVNHGSTDGTLAYFQSKNPDKLLNISVNGGGHSAFSRIVEGKYTLSISNDVIITKNAIQNMYRLMEEDPRVAYIVPSTPNTSNLQGIPAEYSDLEGMHRFAEQNNVYNPYRHERRVRLCNPLVMFRNSVLYSRMTGILPYGHLHSSSQNSFGDDKASMFFRRNGYKNILQKDVYCFHFGSLTLREETTSNDFDIGRREYMRTFGVDPWGKEMCFDPELMDVLPLVSFCEPRILGVNCQYGSTPLKVKEALREKFSRDDIVLHNISDDPRFLPDLSGISDGAAYYTTCEEIRSYLLGNRFCYEVLMQPEKANETLQSLAECVCPLLVPGGYLALESSEPMDLSGMRTVAQTPRWRILQRQGDI